MQLSIGFLKSKVYTSKSLLGLEFWIILARSLLNLSEPFVVKIITIVNRQIPPIIKRIGFCLDAGLKTKIKPINNVKAINKRRNMIILIYILEVLLFLPLKLDRGKFH
jgi:hypothetical protein